MKQIVILPGGFHPYHAGHYSLYNSAKKKFPDADIYVATTDDTSERPFPFKLKQKLAQVAGVNPKQFIKVKSPFRANEITNNYDPKHDVLIFVRSEKDRNEEPHPDLVKKDGSPSYFQSYSNKRLAPFSKHAYLDYLPTVKFGPGIKSASEIRKMWPKLNVKEKGKLVAQLYPNIVDKKNSAKLLANVVKMIDLGMSGTHKNVNESMDYLEEK